MEVCHINVWGTICVSSWGFADAQVACRQLGLPTAGANPFTVSTVPDVNRVSWLNYVECAGTESSLFYCNVRPYETNCYGSEYAGVTCQDSRS